MPVETARPRLLCVAAGTDRLAGLDAILGERYHLDAVGTVDGALARLGDRADVDAVIADLTTTGHDTTLLADLRRLHPGVARIVLADRTDLGVARATADDGDVLRLPWPCRPDDLLDAVDVALAGNQGRRLAASLVDRALNGTVELLCDLIGRIDDDAAERGTRIRHLAGQISAGLGRPIGRELDLAAALSQLGRVVVPVGDGVEPPELLDRRVEIAAELLIHVPGLESVAALVRGQLPPDGRWDQRDRDLWDDRDLDAEVLRLAVRVDDLVLAGHSLDEAVGLIGAGPLHPPGFLLAALGAVREDEDDVDLEIPVDDLRAGMVLQADILLSSGPQLVPAGVELTVTLIDRVRSFAEAPGIAGPVSVRAPASLARLLERSS